MNAQGNKTGGRRKGTPNKATAEIRALALSYGPQALQELARLAGLTRDGEGEPVTGAQSETARLSAIGMLIDRAYGKALPARTIHIELPDTSTVAGMTQALSVIIQAIAAGEITPTEGGDMCSVLEAQRKAIELCDIEARLTRLEAAGARTRG